MAAQVNAFVERTARRLDNALNARVPDGAVKEVVDGMGEGTSAALARAHKVAAKVTFRA